MTEGDVDIAAVAALLADRTRARMLTALAGGVALPAGELARTAGVSAGTASQHLAKLVAADWLAVERHGRHRYYRIDRPDVLNVVESLAKVAPVREVRSLSGARLNDSLRLALTCYDHLAGALGVAVFDALSDQGALEKPEGTWQAGADATVMDRLGIHLPDDAVRRRRPAVRACLDWSQRRHHLAGWLGAAVLRRMIEQRWCERVRGNRSVQVTDTGWRELDRALGIAQGQVLQAVKR